MTARIDTPLMRMSCIRPFVLALSRGVGFAAPVGDHELTR
jgi:hypothetical protein